MDAFADADPELSPSGPDEITLTLRGGAARTIAAELQAGRHGTADEVVEYALSRNLSPALVAQYQLQLPDKQLIAARLHELLAMHDGIDPE